MDEEDGTDVIYLGSSEAFETVDHDFTCKLIRIALDENRVT